MEVDDLEREVSVVATLAMAGLLILVGYGVFQLFVFLDAQAFFEEWIVTLYRVILASFAAYGYKRSGEPVSFWIGLVWVALTFIPVINLVALYFAGRQLARKAVGLI